MKISFSKFELFAGVTKWPQLIFPILIMSLFCLSFSQFLSWLLPNDAANVNAAFVTSSWKVFLLIALGLYILFFVFFKIRKKNKFVFENSVKNLSPADFILILLPLTPVVQYVLKNQDILSMSGSLIIIGGFAAFSIMLVVLIPALFSVVGSAQTLALMGMALTFTITNMASLTAYSKWFERGELKIQLGLFFSIFLVGLLLYNFVGKRFTRFVLTLYFVANSVNSLSFFDKTDADFPSGPIENTMVEIVGDRMPLTRPNIYFLVYDAYVANESMLGYGIDNRAQEDFLKEAGFQLYPKTYSITASTVGTISRVFSVSWQYYGKPRTAISGDGVVQRLLQSFGYNTYGIFWSDYCFRKVGSSYDFSFPDLNHPHLTLAKAILMGEFRFDFEFAKSSRTEFLDYQRLVFEENGGAPQFFYMHDNRPGHSQNSGVCLPDEIEKYEMKLNDANAEMRKNVDLIIRNHPDAIVIVAGDHGPYLTKNCTHTHDEYDISEISRLDVQDRYGTFLAIKWPSGEYSKYDDIIVLQDLFPAIFSFLFEDNQFLSARIHPVTGSAAVLTSGVVVKNGVIQGGINDGEPLFLK